MTVNGCADKTYFSVTFRTAQNFDGGKYDEFEFPAIHQYFPYQNFPFT